MSEEDAKAIGRLDVLTELARMSVSAAKSAAQVILFVALPAIVLGVVLVLLMAWGREQLTQFLATPLVIVVPTAVKVAADWIVRGVGTLILFGLGIRVWRTAKARVQEREA